MIWRLSQGQTLSCTTWIQLVRPKASMKGPGTPQKTSPASPASASCSEAHCGPWGLRGWCYNCGWMPFLAPKVSKAQATLEATKNTTDLTGNDIENNWGILKFSEDGTLFIDNLLKPIKNLRMVLINLPIKGRPDTKSKLAGRLGLWVLSWFTSWKTLHPSSGLRQCHWAPTDTPSNLEASSATASFFIPGRRMKKKHDALPLRLARNKRIWLVHGDSPTGLWTINCLIG